MLETQFIRADDATSRRLMIVLHGLGDSATGYEWLPSALRLPWMNYLLANNQTPVKDLIGSYLRRRGLVR